MGHDWVFEVLTDMKSYARRHGFDDLAARLEDAEDAARRDIARAEEPGTDDGSSPPADMPQSPARRG